MKQLLIYERPMQLNRVAHKDLRIRATQGDFQFASHLNSVPLACSEFARAACHYPVVFAGNSPDAVVPAVLLGLQPKQNLMVDEAGQWQEDAYVPAFLRRYPFVLAEKEGQDQDFTVCLDAAFKGLVEDGADGEPLFDADGQDTPLLANALKFLQEYQVHLARTRAFSSKLAKLDLLQLKQVRVQPVSGEPFTLDGFFVVDEQKLRELKGKALRELASSGDLGWIYAHLLSLVNVERLTRRLDTRPAVAASH